MAKKKLRIVVTGKPRPDIDPEAMARIIIALGRELAMKQEQEAATNEAGGET